MSHVNNCQFVKIFTLRLEAGRKSGECDRWRSSFQPKLLHPQPSSFLLLPSSSSWGTGRWFQLSLDLLLPSPSSSWRSRNARLPEDCIALWRTGGGPYWSQDLSSLSSSSPFGRTRNEPFFLLHPFTLSLRRRSPAW